MRNANLPRSVLDVLGSLFWPMLWAAVGTALISVIAFGKYLRRPKPSYVSFNLAVNITGLAFTALALFAL
jgi:hypothetical protein